jgi:hypothetical protein
MLASLVETDVQTDRRQSYRYKICAQVSFVAATGKFFNGRISTYESREMMTFCSILDRKCLWLKRYTARKRTLPAGFPSACYY